MAAFNKDTLRKIATLGFGKDKLIGSIPFWNPWPIFSDPKIANLLFKSYEKIISSLVIQADYICPIPTSGYPLLPITLKITQIPALTYPKSQGINIPFDIYSIKNANPRVFLFDTNVNTGIEFGNALRMLKKVNAQIVGFGMIVFNDLVVDYTPSEFQKLLQEKKIHYLISISELGDSLL